MLSVNGFIGDLASCYHSIQDVIAVDAVVLQASGIELDDGPGFTTEAYIGVATVVPDLIKTKVAFMLDEILIIA